MIWTNPFAQFAAVAVLICLSDWGCAASHMAFSDYTMRSPYWRRIPVFGDVFHLVAGLRYLAMGVLAVVVFGYQWEWYLGTALLNSLGWQLLKRLHGKDWPLRLLIKRWATAWSVAHTEPPAYVTPGEGED